MIMSNSPYFLMNSMSNSKSFKQFEIANYFDYFSKLKLKITTIYGKNYTFQRFVFAFDYEKLAKGDNVPLRIAFSPACHGAGFYNGGIEQHDSSDWLGADRKLWRKYIDYLRRLAHMAVKCLLI